MKNLLLGRQSITTRITVTVLTIFLVGLWFMSYYLGKTLLTDLEVLMSQQQMATATSIAIDLNDEMKDRLDAVELVARAATPAMVDNPAAVQKFLEERITLQSMFNGGLFILDRKGDAIADFPVSTGRTGINYLDRPYLAQILKDGVTTVGKPILGKTLKTPVFGIAAAIKDGQGNVIGALVGIIDLGRPNFLERVRDSSYARAGDILVVSPRYRLIVTASDPKRDLEVLPPPGAHPTIDRFVNGYEGNAIFVNIFGREVLASVKKIPDAAWYVAVVMPTEKAFAPVHEMQRRMMFGTLLLTLLAAGLTWLAMRHQLAPLIDAAKTMGAMAESSMAPQRLPIVREDEVGTLIGGFNQLVGTLNEREQTIVEAKATLEAAIGSMSDAVQILDSSGYFAYINDAFAAFYRFTSTAACSRVFDEYPEFLELYAPDGTLLAPAQWSAPRALRGETAVNVERRLRRKDTGETWMGSISFAPIRSASGEIVGAVVVSRDITAMKEAEQAIRTMNATLEERIRERTAQLEVSNRSLAAAKDGAESANQAKSAFIANMSHEIRTPLNAITGMAELIRRSGVTPQQLARLDQIDTASQHLLALINDILDISKIEAGKFTLEAVSVNIPSITANVLSILAERAQAKGLKLQVESDPLPARLLGDPSRLQQALLN